MFFIKHEEHLANKLFYPIEAIFSFKNLRLTPFSQSVLLHSKTNTNCHGILNLQFLYKMNISTFFSHNSNSNMAVLEFQI